MRRAVIANRKRVRQACRKGVGLMAAEEFEKRPESLLQDVLQLPASYKVVKL